MRLGRRWCPVPAKPAFPTSLISRYRSRRRRRCSRRAFSTCVRLTPISIAPRLGPSIAPARRSMVDASSHSLAKPTSAHSWTACGRTRSKAGRVRPDRSSICCCAATRSTSSMAPWTAMPLSAFPTSPTLPRPVGGDMANEKVDVVIVGAGASGSVFAAVLAKAGKKVVVLEQGPDWQLTDLISSDFWGRRIKPAGGPFLLEGKNPFGYVYQAGWGVGGAALHYFARFPRLLPNDFKIRSEHGRALDWPISYSDVAPYYDKVAQDVGVSGDAKAEETWRPAGEPYPMPPMKTFLNGQVWLKGFEAAGVRLVPAAVGMNSTEFKGRSACIYDGWCHVGCPIGALANPLVTYLGDARKAGAEVRTWSTVTRVLTNNQGTRVAGVEYYDRNKERQVQEANVVVLAAWAAQNPRLLLNSAIDKHPKGLANSNGLVGKYMMTHSAFGTSAIFNEDLQNHIGTTGA